jgi:4-hydroxy-tetrahydrodipicolinate synthase
MTQSILKPKPMETKNKFSRKTFIKRITATGIVASVSIRSYGNPPAEINPAPSTMEHLAKAEDKKFVPVMITPFLQSGKIDFDTLTRLIDFYLAAGVKGFFANCLSSEMYHLDEEERLALTRHVVKRVNGVVPVVATGSFGATMEERVDFAKKIYDTGVKAVILISSHYATKEESDATLLSNIERMLELTGNIPMGLYECPSPYKRIVSAEVFKALLETKRMVYHKDTSIDRDKIKAKLALIKNNPMEFYDAHTANTVFSLQNGAKGMSAISGNFYPEILVWMCNHATDPLRQKDVQWLQTELEKTENLISKAYPMSSKYFLEKRGVPIQPVSRSSAQPLTAEQKKTLDGVHQTFLGWCQRLGIEHVSMQ